MDSLVSSYGRALTGFFFLAVTAWVILLIVGPQISVLETSLKQPERQLDSSVAAQLVQDASTCRTVLERLGASEAKGDSDSGLAVPTVGGAHAPAARDSSSLGVPSIGGVGAGDEKAVRPYVLQCDRARTDARLVRGVGQSDGFALNDAYGAPLAFVDARAPVAAQLAQADRVQQIAREIARRARHREAQSYPYGFDNYATLALARLIPLSEAAKADKESRLWTRLLNLTGLRFEREGVIYLRLGLATLFMTIVYAVMATALALAVCYPIAFNLALASTPRKAVWLFLALLIPYAIVELMRVYAWVSILENDGLLNRLLDVVGLVDIAGGEYVPFKRYPGTVFVVIVYTYILFMAFPLVNVMSTLDRAQLEAARDLGASNWKLHTRIVIPHTKPGIAVGCIATFMLAAGAFSVPRIISRGLQSEWFTQTIYNKFFESQNPNVGSAYAFSYTLVCFAIVAIFMWAMRARLRDFLRA